MTISVRAIAVQGIGFVALSLATLGLIAPTEPLNTAGKPGATSAQVVTDVTRVANSSHECQTRTVRCSARVSLNDATTDVTTQFGAKQVGSMSPSRKTQVLSTATSQSSTQRPKRSVSAERIVKTSVAVEAVERSEDAVVPAKKVNVTP